MSGENEDLNNQTIDLIFKAKKGSSEALEALYNLYEARLRRAVRHNIKGKLQAKMDSMDLVQSVWKDCLSNINNFEYQGTESFFRWLLAQIYRKLKDKVRYFNAEKRNINNERHIGHQSSSDDQPTHESPSPSPSKVAVANENIDRLMRYLDHLPDSQREVLVYRMKDNKEFDEIGKLIGKTSGAARQLYRRAIIRIGKIIENTTK